MIARRVSLALLLLLAILFTADPIEAQCVSLTTAGSPSTQNFNGLSSTVATGVAWTDNSTLAGWYSTRTTFNVGTGSSNTGALWDFGVAGVNAVTERALGGVGSGGTGTFYWAACFTNNTGSALSSVDIAYVGEQWRDGGAATPVSQTMAVEYQVAAAATITDADTPTTGWTAAASLDFVSPTFTNTTTGAALDGNAAANRTAKAASLIVAVPVGNQFWIRWRDINDGGNDHGLAVDDFSITPQAGGNAAILPSCPGPLTTTSGSATSGGVSATDTDGTVTSATITGISPSDPGTITLTGFTPAGGVGGTSNATLSVSAATPASTYSVTIQWANNDGSPQTANCVVSVTVFPPPSVVFIHEVQGSGAATPIPGTTVQIEGVVIGDYQGANQLNGFFLQEEGADADSDPSTSEGIFVFCGGCPTAVAEGQKVQVIGVVSEFNGMTEVTASTAASVVVTNAGNNLAQVTAAPIDLPVAGVINTFYEAREGMLVTFIDTLTVAEYFELARFGHIELFEGGRPHQFTEHNTPSLAGYNAQLANLDARRVILDDDNNNQNGNLTPFQAEGMQFVFHPQANGGLSIGTQGTDFFRGGDLVNGLTGVLHWSFPGTGADTWRIRPTSATPATFTVANPRPATPPAVGGAIRAVGMNMLNYFTTIDTTSSTSSGPCGPGGTLDCRGADNVTELNRQRERASIVICALDPDVAGLMEVENTTATVTITDLLGAVNARCGGAHPYAYVNTGGTLGTDAIRNFIIHRTGVLSPVGAALVDLDPVHNRPPTAQTFDVVDATNPAFGQRFTFIPNHFKSKGCPGSGADDDAGDGAGCFNGTRTAQAARMLTWITNTVLPSAGDPDVLMVGDFNSYASESPVTTLEAGGFTDLTTAFIGPATYSYLFDGQLGHLDYAFASASLLGQVTGADDWHINADEIPLFDFSDEVKDTGESAFEEKPDGSSLTPSRGVFQGSSPFRASDHDPVVVGIFAIADLKLTKTGSPDPVHAGNNLTYTITVTNNGPDAAATTSWSDTLPAGTTFVSLPAVAGWSCTTPAVGAAGDVDCSNPSMGIGDAIFTLTVNVAPTVAAGTVLSNSATITSATGEGNPGDETGTADTTVATSADLSVTKADTPDPVTAGENLTYTITVNNAGPSNAASVSLSDLLPTGTTFVSLSPPGGWSCATPAVGGTGNVSCTIAALGIGNAVFTLTVNVNASVPAGTVISNSATVSSTTLDPNSGNETSPSADTTVAASADLSMTKVDTPDPVTAGTNLTYTITVNNAGPSNAASVSVTDQTPSGTTFVSLSPPGGWSCATPAVGGTGNVSCTIAALGIGNAVFTLTVNVDSSVAAGTAISNSAAVTSGTPDPNMGNNSGSADTTVGVGSADLSVILTDNPDPVMPDASLVYTITVNNAGTTNATGATLNVPVPANTTFTSLASPGGWSCTTPAAGGTGPVNCTKPSLALGDAGFTLTVDVDPAVAPNTLLTATATVSSATNDPNTGNESDSETTAVISPASVSATKSAAGTFVPGSTVTYTIQLTNNGPAMQANNPTNEFTDVLPPQLALVSATATFGAVGISVGTNTVIWNGSIPPGGSLTITIQATIDSAIAPGTTITNQGAIAFDMDGDGTNETSSDTDGASDTNGDNPTSFAVAAAAAAVDNIPALDALGLLALTALLGALGFVFLRRS